MRHSRAFGVVASTVFVLCVSVGAVALTRGDSSSHTPAGAVGSPSATATTTSSPYPESVFAPRSFDIPQGWHFVPPASDAVAPVGAQSITSNLPASFSVVAEDLVLFSMDGRSDIQGRLSYAIVERGTESLADITHAYVASPGAGSANKVFKVDVFSVVDANNGYLIAKEIVPTGVPFTTIGTSDG